MLISKARRRKKETTKIPKSYEHAVNVALLPGGFAMRKMQSNVELDNGNRLIVKQKTKQNETKNLFTASNTISNNIPVDSINVTESI